MDSKPIFIHAQLAVIDIVLTRNPLEEYQEINVLLGNIIDSLPMVLPFENDANFPPEIPIVQSNNKKGIGINVGKSRVDFLYTISPENNIEDFVEKSKKIINKYKKVGIGRIGIVGQYILDKQNPSKWIKETFLKNIGTTSDEILVRYNNKEKLFGISINKIIQVQEVLANENGVDKKKVHFQIDINTPLNPGNRLSVDKIIQILDAKIPQLKDVTVKGIIA